MTFYRVNNSMEIYDWIVLIKQKRLAIGKFDKSIRYKLTKGWKYFRANEESIMGFKKAFLRTTFKSFRENKNSKIFPPYVQCFINAVVACKENDI